MTPCKFTFDHARTFDGFALNSTWNGFDNVAVTVAVRDEIKRYFADDPDTAESFDIDPDETGLVSLAWGFATVRIE